MQIAAGPVAVTRARAAFMFAVLAAAVAVTFLGSLENEAVWDDAWITTRNPFLQSLSGLPRLLTSVEPDALHEGLRRYYRPVAMLSFAASRWLSGNSSASYRAGNLLLHALNAFLLALLPGAGRAKLSGRGVAALLFAVAPITVEAVAWISGRFDLLGSTFVLAALLVNVRPGGWARASSTLLVLLAMLSKESFAVAPAIVLLQEIMLLRRSLRAVGGTVARYTAVAAAFVLVRRFGGVASAPAFSAASLTAVALSYAFVLRTFVGALAFPTDLSPFRTYAPPSLREAAAVFGVVAVTGLALFLASRRWRRDARVSDMSFGLAWMLVGFAPVALAGPAFGMVGDRYAYFPLMGVFFIIGAVAESVWPRTAKARALAAAAVVACLVWLAWRSRVRILDWRTERVLYEATLRDDPENAYGLYALGALEAQAHRLAQADALLEHSLARDPGSWRTLDALCFVRLNQSRPTEAVAYCEKSAHIQPANPRTWINLASARVNQNEWALSLDAATRALLLKPRSAEAHYLRAVSLANLGDLEAGRAELARALELDPAHAGALSLLEQFNARGVP